MFFNEKARSSQRETSAARRPSSAGSSGTSQEDDVRGRKRKRVQRACDMCRLKKIRCEGGQPSRKACIHCIMNKYDCTYLQMVERDKAYVQILEIRLERMEQLVRKVCPEIDIPNDLLSMEPSSSSNLEGPLSSSLRATPPELQSTGDALIEHHDSDSEEEQIDGREILAEYFEKVSLNSHFFGNSSGLSLIRTAMDYKDDGRQRPRSLSTKPPQKQLEFWESYTWHDRPFGPRHNFIYPDDDLIPSLVDNYFKEYNPYFPVLHRPTFEDAITSKLHHCDEGFGATLLLVCACGARLSQDPRVFEDEKRKRYSAGVRWFNQVKRTMVIMREEMPRLYDIQICALSAQYASGLLNPASLVWAVLGHGLRMAQSLGAHRRMVYNVMPAVQRELLKRAFWVLVQIDKDFCYFLGRPCLIKDKDCDVDLPVECDDEYWQISDPAAFFKQPEGKPSYMSYFNEWIKLNRIQSHALHTIYSITKSKVESGHIGPEWEERTAVELESALNLWLDKLPKHLRWDPKQKDFVFLTQSAALHVAFHNLQIVVHRPFISLRRQRPTPFPSLTICAIAARSALKIVDIQFRRACAEDRIKLPLLGMILVPTLILLLNIWHARRANPNVCVQKDLEHIHLALHMLMALEPMWGAAGRAGIRGSISELLLAGELPLPDPAQSPYQGAIPPLNLPSTSSQSGNGSVPSSSLGGFAVDVPSGSYYPDLYESLPTATQTATLPTFALNDNIAYSQSSMITGLPAMANQNAWNPSALPQGSPFAVSNQQPASSNAMNNFMRTFVEMSSRNPTFASIQPTVPLSYTPSERTNAGEEPTWNGPPNFEWGDWVRISVLGTNLHRVRDGN